MGLTVLNLLAAATSPAGSASGGSGAFTFTLTPNASGAPGASGIQSGIDVLAAYALWGCGAGFVLGALTLAMGKHVGNDYTATGGKVAMVTCGLVAFLVGAAPKILQWTYGLG
jgi:hypothetical protein